MAAPHHGALAVHVTAQGSSGGEAAALSEFGLIARFFTRPARSAVLGVGDDAALLRVDAGMELAVSTDMLVSGRHFLPEADPYRLGHKALAVNLSDIAAMGGTPRWATLALALPAADPAWLEPFSRGFLDLALRFGVDLIGGDTTRGPLNVCVSILGEVQAGCALRRDGARVGDDVWVSGTLGDAALGLAHLQGRESLAAADASACVDRLELPEPRVALGRALLGVASAALDVSDGLAGDLGHILARSGAGARVEIDALPRSAAFARWAATAGGDSAARARALQLGGGDDYELCFCAPPARRDAVAAAAAACDLRVTRIGAIEAGTALVLVDRGGGVVTGVAGGFDHFR
jgi:thiamine-monophosphate kinase